jgi:hypothetical protein
MGHAVVGEFVVELLYLMFIGGTVSFGAGLVKDALLPFIASANIRNFVDLAKQTNGDIVFPHVDESPAESLDAADEGLLEDHYFFLREAVVRSLFEQRFENLGARLQGFLILFLAFSVQELAVEQLLFDAADVHAVRVLELMSIVGVEIVAEGHVVSKLIDFREGRNLLRVLKFTDFDDNVMLYFRTCPVADTIEFILDADMSIIAVVRVDFANHCEFSEASQ